MTEAERNNEYEALLQEHGPTYAGVGWLPQECLGQYMAMRNLLDVRATDSVLDIGCGLGFGYNAFHDCNFTGIDTSKVHIETARNLLVGGDAEFKHSTIDEEEEGRTYDYVVLSGIFNLGYTWKEVESLCKKAHAKATIGIGVGFQINNAEGMTIFPISNWTGLMHKLCGKPYGYALDLSFSKINGVVIAGKV